jgi:hypothetical protein
MQSLSWVVAPLPKASVFALQRPDAETLLAILEGYQIQQYPSTGAQSQ